MTQTREHRHKIDVFKLAAPDCCNKFPYIVLFQRGDFFFIDLRQIAGISGIVFQFSDLDRLIQRLMEYTIDILNYNFPNG